MVMCVTQKAASTSGKESEGERLGKDLGRRDLVSPRHLGPFSYATRRGMQCPPGPTMIGGSTATRAVGRSVGMRINKSKQKFSFDKSN